MHRPSRPSILGVGAAYATAPAASAGESARRRFARGIGTVVLGLAILVGWELTPPAVQPVAAACATGSCATLEIVFSAGTGSGLVTTFPFGMDCTWTGSSRTGTCVQQFDVSAGGTAVTLYLDPGVKSYACFGTVCGGLEERMTPTVMLFPGNDLDFLLVFNLANKTRVSMTSSGTGSGRTTTSPAGIDCRWNGAVESGTCEADYWYTTESMTLKILSAPTDAGSFACRSQTACGIPGAVFSHLASLSPGLSGPPSQFWITKPVTVAVTGPGKLISYPAGISCPPTCSMWFSPGTVMTFTAQPGADATLIDWTDECDLRASYQNTCALTLSYFGAKVGVQFESTILVTPAPTVRVTPRPTAAPTAKPTPGSPPTSTSGAQPPSGAPSPVPGSVGPGLPAPGASPVLDGSGADPTGLEPPSVEPTTPGSVAVASTLAPGSIAPPLVTGQPSNDADAILVVLVVVLATALGLVVSGVVIYALVRRRRDAAPTRPRA